MRTQPELSVEMWWCGDEYCNCTRPQVVVRYPMDKPKPNIGICEVIAEGPFISMGYGSPEPGEVVEQKRWLRKAEKWYRTRHVCGEECRPSPSKGAKKKYQEKK